MPNNDAVEFLGRCESYETSHVAVHRNFVEQLQPRCRGTLGICKRNAEGYRDNGGGCYNVWVTRHGISCLARRCRAARPQCVHLRVPRSVCLAKGHPTLTFHLAEWQRRGTAHLQASMFGIQEADVQGRVGRDLKAFARCPLLRQGFFLPCSIVGVSHTL